MRRTMMTKWALLSLLTVGDSVETEINGIKGIVSSIQREDGSGKSFNVTLNTKLGKTTTHVRTID